MRVLLLVVVQGDYCLNSRVFWFKCVYVIPPPYLDTLRLQSSSSASSYTLALLPTMFTSTTGLQQSSIKSSSSTASALEPFLNNSTNSHSSNHYSSTANRSLPSSKCGVCSKLCLSNAALRRHMRTHTGERPYPCPVCPYAARQRYDLTRHITALHSTALKGGVDGSATST